MAKISKAMAARKAMTERGTIPAKKNEVDDAAEIRDIINYMVGSGGTNFAADQAAKNNLSVLSGIVGRERAQKLAMSAYMFNQRQVGANMSPEQRISTFYSMGSRDPDTQELIKRASFGTGPVAGYYNTVNRDVQNLNK